MKSTRKKILIIKSDKIGDFINFSPCLKILKDNMNDCHITIIASAYNYKIAKNYNQIDKLIVFNGKYFLLNLLQNFKALFFNRYDFTFQFDGKKSSYWLSFFIRSKVKSTICFIKQKNVLGYKYENYRPNRIFLKFFKNYEFSDENYSNNSHYQSIYFRLLKNLNLVVLSKKNLFYLDSSFEKTFSNLGKSIFIKEYMLFHFDEKWDKFDESDRINILKIINTVSLKKKIIITLGVKKFNFASTLKDNFTSYNFIYNELNLQNQKNNKDIVLLDNIPLNLLAYLIKNSIKNISSHAGAIVHISAAFDIEIIDLVKRNKNKEYDRWIPLICNYKRINFEDINDKLISNF